MFHYFHGGLHPEGQGSLSAADLEALLEFVGVDRIVSPDDWCRRVERDALDGAVCLSFDDGLRSQYDVATPVLERLGLAAFYFVHTSVLDAPPTGPELYRYFRNVAFGDVDDFYRAFFDALDEGTSGRVEVALAEFDPASYLVEHPFYTDADRVFRFVRDEVLGPAEYHVVMDRMIGASGLDRDSVSDALWVRPEHLRELESRGHVVGLHSHTHPMRLDWLSYEEQLDEYRTNFEVLAGILETPPRTVSHPENRRNETTFRVLEELGVRVGFRANLGTTWSRLDLPREDSANIFEAMRESHSLHE
jgi:peptidoglycan/xylan/chitin deacetylase (PgdA/CDA1 family)